MKNEYQDVSKNQPQPKEPAPPPKDTAGYEADGTPRSISLMASMMYEVAVAAYGIDAQSYRYSYVEFSDGGYGLRFYPDEESLAPTANPTLDHYRRKAEMLRDMQVLAEGCSDIYINPEALELYFTRKAALLDVLCDLVTDEERGLSNPESIDTEERLSELLAPLNIPDNRHSRLEAFSAVARKLDAALEASPEMAEIAKLTFLPRAFGSLAEQKASLVTVMDADMTSCFGHILKTIQQEDKIDTKDQKSEMNFGGYN